MSQSHIGGVSRREFLAKVAAGGAGALMSFAGPVIEKAYGAGPCSGHLTDIEHFVFFMQENRSFDHYFGTLSGTDGFNTVSPLFQQKGWNPMTQALDATGVTMPYRFDTTRGPFLDGACVNDPDHSWVAMHESWNGGVNDNWLPAQAKTRSLLLGIGSHPAQPPLLAERHHRPRRPKWWAGAAESHFPTGAEIRLAHHAAEP